MQERVITRLGSNEAVPLDVRFIATSKVDLEAEVAAGRFRADLFYRLNVVTLHVPSLSQRRADVPLLFLQLVREAAARYGRDEMDVPPDVISDIAQRDWPGNVRELRNAADRLVLGLGLDNGGAAEAEEATVRLADRVAEFERGIIASALVAHGGSLKPVYELLGISRKTLYEKMQKYGLDKRMLTTEASSELGRCCNLAVRWVDFHPRARAVCFRIHPCCIAAVVKSSFESAAMIAVDFSQAANRLIRTGAGGCCRAGLAYFIREETMKSF